MKALFSAALISVAVMFVGAMLLVIAKRILDKYF